MQDKGKFLVSVLLYSVNLLCSETAAVSSSRVAVFLQIIICFYILGWNASLASLYIVENKNIQSAIYSWPQVSLNLP